MKVLTVVVILLALGLGYFGFDILCPEWCWV